MYGDLPTDKIDMEIVTIAHQIGILQTRLIVLKRDRIIAWEEVKEMERQKQIVLGIKLLK